MTADSVMTPPWKVEPWDLSKDFAKIQQQWPTLTAILQDPTRFDLHHPTTSGWRCGEHASHIVLAASGIARNIIGALAEPVRDQDKAPPDWVIALLESGTIPRGTAKAPERLDPTLHSRADIVAMVPAAMSNWSSLATRAHEMAASPTRLQHFVLGHLSFTEWTRFCAVHTAHHLAIVRDIEEASHPLPSP